LDPISTRLESAQWALSFIIKLLTNIDTLLLGVHNIVFLKSLMNDPC